MPVLFRPPSIAESHGRDSTNDSVRFLSVSNGSLYELQTQVEIAKNLQYLETAIFEGLYEEVRAIERMMSRLVRKLKAGAKALRHKAEQHCAPLTPRRNRCHRLN